MILSASLIDINFPLFISGFGGLILLILFLASRRKLKISSAENLLLKTEIEQLKTKLEFKSKSLDDEITIKTKVLLEEIENRKALEVERKVALKKAEESSFLKNSFFANMSLEIRTPLNGIIGFSRLLLNDVKLKEKPELIDFADGIEKSGNRLLYLMENIIDLSRIDTKDYSLKIEAFEISEVIDKSIQKAKEESLLNEGINIKYDQTQNYWAKGDKTAFRKTLDIILDNAIKYTVEGTIKIRINKDDKKSILQVIVSDTGIGIDNSFLTDIFEAFRHINTGYSRLQQGAGLGLPLAKKLMLLMDGDLKIKSKKGFGTEVSLFLPLQAQTDSNKALIPNDKQLISTTSTSTERPSIFIVEDDKMNRLIFEKILKSFGEVKIAIDGDDGFKQLEYIIQSNLKLDIILLDINLPAPWDGIILLNEFKKKWPILRNIPFVAQTAYAMTGDKERFLAAGFDDYISKPIDKKELFAIIENNIRKFRSLKL